MNYEEAYKKLRAAAERLDAHLASYDEYYSRNEWFEALWPAKKAVAAALAEANESEAACPRCGYTDGAHKYARCTTGAEKP